MLGIILAIRIGNSRFVAAGGKAGVTGEVALFAVPAGIIGGRLYHVITSPEGYFGSGGEPIKIIYIWEGGLGIWGAIALGAVAAYFAFKKYAPRDGASFAIFADALAPGLLVAQGVGRFGNWFNKELFGKPLDAPWALEIPARYRPIGFSQFETFHPTFLYEATWCFILAGILIYTEKRARAKNRWGHGSTFALYVALYSLGRGLIEQLRIDQANEILGFRLNSWTSLTFLITGLFFLYRINRGLSRSDSKV